MKRAKEIEILRESLALTREKRRPIDGDEAIFPTEDYVDPARFERELELLRRELNLVALAAQVSSPGDFLTREVAGTPVLIVRGEDARIRAFLNVCRHRGATVEPRAGGNCKRFVCPYHAWTYATDGSLQHVRLPEGFPTLETADHGLVELPCLEVAGLVFVCPTPGAVPEPLPEALVDELEAMLGSEPQLYASTTRDWKANWKIVVEGGIESYHFRVAHKDTIASYFTDTLSTWEAIGPHLRMVLPKRSIAELAEQPEDTWELREHTHVVYSLRPNAMILLQQSHFDVILLTPLGVDETRIEVLTAAGTLDGKEPKKASFLEKNHAFSVRTLDEDFVIAEQIQRGLRTPANTHFRFARFEGALTHWHRQLDAELERG